MPRTLEFNDSHLDARVMRRGIVARLTAHPEVFRVERVVVAHPARDGYVLYHVALRTESDSQDTYLPDDPNLRRIFEEFAFASPQIQVGTPVSTLTPEVRDRLVSQFIATSEGRSRLAQSMISPLRARLDYQSVARRTFLVEQLPDGALPSYDRDPEVGRMVTDTLGQGWDGNGSPLAAPPAWVQAGQWAYNPMRDEYLLILEREPKSPILHGIKAEIWRSPEPPRWFDVDYLYENWQPCEPPSDPKPVWDRLLGDDTL